MTGRELFNKAMILLGYTDSDGSVQMSDRINSRALTCVNQVYADLFYASYSGRAFSPLTNLSGVVELPERILNEVAPYGVASFIAQSEGDGENNQIFIALFNKKRNLLTHFEKIKDEFWG